jgi:hypothetical protein
LCVEERKKKLLVICLFLSLVRKKRKNSYIMATEWEKKH